MLPKSVVSFCKKHGISFEQETDTEVLFTAPEGYIFSTESSARLLNTEDYYVGHKRVKITAKEMKNCLFIQKKS